MDWMSLELTQFEKKLIYFSNYRQQIDTAFHVLNRKSRSDHYKPGVSKLLSSAVRLREFTAIKTLKTSPKIQLSIN